MAAGKSIVIRLGGDDHTLRFTNRAIVELEDRFGLTLTEVGQQLQRGSLKTIAAVLWAGMQHETPAPDFQNVIDTLDLRELEAVSTAIAEALVAALGTAQSAEPAEGNAEPVAA